MFFYKLTIMTSINLDSLPEIFRRCALGEFTFGAGEAALIVGGCSAFPNVSLPNEEMERALRIRDTPSRNRFLAGRRIVRGALSSLLETKPSDIRIECTPEGKPYLSFRDMPRFSISHSGDLVAVAISHDDIGVDLEQERSLDTKSLSRRFFPPDEALAFDHGENLQHFFRLWNCREAAIKADGRGLGSLLSESSVGKPLLGEVQGEGCRSVRIGDEAWMAIPWSLRGGYHGAVACRSLPKGIHWCDLR